MRIFNVLAVLFLTAPFITLAQSNFKKGYVITSSGDTISGLIDLKEWEKTPQSVSFKRSEDKKSETLDTTSLRGFAIAGIDSYEKFSTSVSLNETDFRSMPDVQDTTSEVRTIFLKTLQKGQRISLYSYTDKIKTRFYILKSGGNSAIEELLYRPYIEDGKIKNAFLYANQLLGLVNQYGVYSSKIESKLKTSQYEEKDILHVIRYINGITVTKKAKTMPRFFAGLSVNQSQIKYSGDHKMAEGSVTNKSQILPGISLGVDAFRNKNVQKLILRLEAKVSLADASVSRDYKTYSSSYRIVHNLKYLNLSITPQLIYNLYNRAQFKAFIGGGLSVNYIKVSKNDYFEKDLGPYTNYTLSREIDLNKYIYSFPVRLGTVVNKKFELYLSHTFPMPLDNYVNYSIAIPETAVGINYLFNKKQKK